MPELRAHRLSKHFSGVRVVKDVSLTIRPGEVVGYLGPNGSGKTTTARMLAGLLEPSSGHVEYANRDIRDDLVAYLQQLDITNARVQITAPADGSRVVHLTTVSGTVLPEVTGVDVFVDGAGPIAATVAITPTPAVIPTRQGRSSTCRRLAAVSRPGWARGR